MNERKYIYGRFPQNLRVLSANAQTVRTCKLSQAKTTKNIDADEVHNNLPLPHSHHIQESTTYMVVRSKDVHTEGGKERERETDQELREGLVSHKS